MQPRNDNRRSQGTKRGATLIEVAVVMAVFLVTSTLVAQGIFNTREASRRSTCMNNLRQIGIALHNYHDVYSMFPPGWTAPNNAPATGPAFGWQMFVTPFLDRANIYESVDFDRPPARPIHLFQTRISEYRCPTNLSPDVNVSRSHYGSTSYSGNFGDKPLPRLAPGRSARFWAGAAPTPMGISDLRRATGFFWLNSSVRMRDVTDGTSNTIMVGERSMKSGGGIWAGVVQNRFEDDQVTDASPLSPLNSSNSFSSYHEGGMQFLRADGSTIFISSKIDTGSLEKPGTLQFLANRSDGQDLPDY